MNQGGQEAFNTHLNYVSCLAGLTSGLRATTSISLKKAPTPHVTDKDGLIRLTQRSLSDEFDIVQIDNDFSFASTSWLPVKSYYLVFNIMLATEYLLTLDKKTYQKGHVACIKEFTRKLETKELSFS